MAVALDTLQLAKDLRAASFSDVQAEAIAHAMLAAQEAGLAEVATKKEMLTLSSELRLEMAELRSGLRQEMTELRSELRQEMAELRGELRQEMAELRQEMVALRGDLSTEIVRSRNVLIMWLVPIMIGQTGLVAALVKLLSP